MHNGEFYSPQDRNNSKKKGVIWGRFTVSKLLISILHLLVAEWGGAKLKAGVFVLLLYLPIVISRSGSIII